MKAIAAQAFTLMHFFRAGTFEWEYFCHRIIAKTINLDFLKYTLVGKNALRQVSTALVVHCLNP